MPMQFPRKITIQKVKTKYLYICTTTFGYSLLEKVEEDNYVRILMQLFIKKGQFRLSFKKHY